MEYKRELLKLEELKKLILKEKDKQRQIFLISDYCNIIAYLNNLNVIQDIDSYFEEIGTIFNNYYYAVQKEKMRYGRSFINNIEIIFDITNKLIELTKKHQINIMENRDPFLPIDIKLGNEIINDFFGSLNSEFYHLYEMLFDEERVSTTSMIDALGMSYNVNYTDKPYIILYNNGKYYDYEFLSSLTHEIGHCYEFTTVKTNKVYQMYLLAEVSSLFLQKLFDEYSIKNNFYLKEVEKSQILWQKSLSQRNLVNDFTNKIILDGNLSSLDYDKGFFDINIAKYGINYLNKDVEYSLDKFAANLDNYLYVIGDHIANNFVKLYKDNPKEALKEFKNFLLTMDKVSISDNLKRYSNDYSEEEMILEKIKRIEG